MERERKRESRRGWRGEESGGVIIWYVRDLVLFLSNFESLWAAQLRATLASRNYRPSSLSSSVLPSSLSFLLLLLLLFLFLFFFPEEKRREENQAVGYASRKRLEIRLTTPTTGGKGGWRLSSVLKIKYFQLHPSL